MTTIKLLAKAAEAIKNDPNLYNLIENLDRASNGKEILVALDTYESSSNTGA